MTIRDTHGCGHGGQAGEAEPLPLTSRSSSGEQSRAAVPNPSGKCRFAGLMLILALGFSAGRADAQTAGQCPHEVGARISQEELHERLRAHELSVTNKG